MDTLTETVLLTLMAGLAMPTGALLSLLDHARGKTRAREFRHGMMAFGGGALLSAVALVLVPEGIEDLSASGAIASFLAGGIVFFALDVMLSRSGSNFSQLVAMLTDFVPEAVALGASLAFGSESAFLLALLMVLQNIPEGFNAYHDLDQDKSFHKRHILLTFFLLALLGPVCGLLGYFFLANADTLLSILMLAAGGGILYIVFGDIAPQAKLKNDWFPPLGCVLGFALGLGGHMLISA